ncbi:MAG: hypothetical protein ABWZ57_06085 [Mesorhizobium sp.]|jgi:hypothetical protein
MASPPKPERQAAAIDQRLVAGFLLGPLLGAALYAAIVGLTGAGREGFWYYLASSLAYGYATSLVVLLPAFLLLRHLRLDRLLVCAGVGLVTGFVFYRLVFHTPTTEANLPALLLYGAMPFLFIAVAIRLIAGKRA